MSLKPQRSTRIEPSDEDPTPECYVLGGGPVGETIAERLRADGYASAVVDESYSSARVPGHRGDPADIQTLEDAGVSEEATVIVATGEDRRNLLIAQLAAVHFDVSDVFVLANTPDGYEPLADAGHRPICVTTALSETVVDSL
jgi:trk system potassium uptake protein TrkA